MSRFVHYLNKEVGWLGMPWFILKSVFVAVIVSFIMLNALSFVLDFFGLSISSKHVGDLPGPRYEAFSLFIILMFLAFFEELAFRAPLTILGWFGADRTIVVFLFVLSAIFGYIHGNWANIPLQGVSGLIFGIVYLKCGGMQGKFFKPIIASTTTHAGFNFCLIAPFILAGR